MTDKELWKEFIAKFPCYKDEIYESWCYGGNDPNLLAQLTIDGIKTSTASAYPFYEYEKCDLPKVGEFSIILNKSNEALCVIKTTDVTIVPFLKVTKEHAFNEGEGDRSLEYWREVHKNVFSAELAEIGKSFFDDMLVVCEKFEVLYKLY